LTGATCAGRNKEVEVDFALRVFQTIGKNASCDLSGG
jgi:hypothetical protein